MKESRTMEKTLKLHLTCRRRSIDGGTPKQKVQTLSALMTKKKKKKKTISNNK